MNTEAWSSDRGVEPEALYAHYARELTQFASVLVGPAEAGDVVSDAILRCWRSGRLAEVNEVHAYLHRAVLNQARQWVRSGERRRRREVDFGRSQAHVVSTEAERGEVWEAVAGLSVPPAGVIYFAYWQDLAPAQIAELLSISEGSVRRHLARARAHLREVLSDE